MTSEHGGHNTLVRVGQQHNRHYLVLHKYSGPQRVGPELLQAIDDALKVRYGDHRWTSFDYVEIVQWEV